MKIINMSGSLPTALRESKVRIQKCFNTDTGKESQAISLEENKMTNIKTLNENALLRAVGGNNGDSKIEEETGVPLFSVGQNVEIFIMHFFHIHTKHAVVLEVKREASGFLYTVLCDNGLIRNYYADDIER